MGANTVNHHIADPPNFSHGDPPGKGSRPPPMFCDLRSAKEWEDTPVTLTNHIIALPTHRVSGWSSPWKPTRGTTADDCPAHPFSGSVFQMLARTPARMFFELGARCGIFTDRPDENFATLLCGTHATCDHVCALTKPSQTEMCTGCTQLGSTHRHAARGFMSSICHICTLPTPRC